VIDEFWVMGAGEGNDDTRAVAPVAAKPPAERFATEAKRLETLNKVFIPVCELASKNVSATKKLEKYLGSLLTKLSKSDTTNQVITPNPLKIGRSQNQARHQNRDFAPGSKINKKAGKDATKARKQERKQEQKSRSNKSMGI
jgi:hypothetical protein